MWDSHNPWTDCLTTSTCFVYNRDVTAFLKAATIKYAGRHMQGNTWIYADGHTKWAKWSAMKMGNILPMASSNPLYHQPCTKWP